MKTQALVLAAAALVLAGPATATEIDKDFQQDFDVEPGATLVLEHGDGDVTITPSDQDVIDVQVRYHVEYSRFGIGSSPDFEVEFEQTGNTVRVSEHHTGSVGIGVHSVRHHEYTYTISAPSYVELDLRGDDGSVVIEGWAADIECVVEDGDVEIDGATCERVSLEVSDGDIRVEKLQANLSIEGDDGDIRLYQCSTPRCRIDLEDGAVVVQECDGEFEIDVDDGDVELEQVAASGLEITGGDGDLDLDLARVDAVDWDVETEDGDIVLHVQQGTSAAFSISTDEGGIDLDLVDPSSVEEKEHSATGEIGDGRGRIRVRSEDGDVTFREVR